MKFRGTHRELAAGREPNRNLVTARKRIRATHVVTVFMRDQNGVEIVDTVACGRDPTLDLRRGEPAIDEDQRLVGFDEGRIASATGTE